MAKETGITIPERVGDAQEISYAHPAGSDFAALARDRVPVRALRADDLRALVGIDRRIVGRDRSAYFERKVAEALQETDLRVSLVAELDGRPIGFIMARVDLGEFGRVEPTAIIDTIGVDPDFRNFGVGRALLSQLIVNLRTLRVERVRTEVDWRDRDLMAYLERFDFVPSQQVCLDLDLAAG
jgi:ribosomal protein S18 acetylase RimI-like enzyme